MAVKSLFECNQLLEVMGNLCKTCAIKHSSMSQQVKMGKVIGPNNIIYAESINWCSGRYYHEGENNKPKSIFIYFRSFKKHSSFFIFGSHLITYLQPKDKSYEFEVVRLKLDTYTAQSHLIWNVVFPISNPHLQDLFGLSFARLF